MLAAHKQQQWWSLAGISMSPAWPGCMLLLLLPAFKCACMAQSSQWHMFCFHACCLVYLKIAKAAESSVSASTVPGYAGSQCVPATAHCQLCCTEAAAGHLAQPKESCSERYFRARTNQRLCAKSSGLFNFSQVWSDSCIACCLQTCHTQQATEPGSTH